MVDALMVVMGYAWPFIVLIAMMAVADQAAKQLKIYKEKCEARQAIYSRPRHRYN